jgi:NADPH:quinone reductase-like Zn-dependent oxidoreductase
MSNPRPEMMQAYVYDAFGAPDVLYKEEVAVPTVQDDEVLIRVHATTATTGDANVRGFTFVPKGMDLLARPMLGIRKPRKRIIGTEVAGEIVAVGEAVTRFAVGDRVFGIGSDSMGAYAEYVNRKADGALVHLPEGMTYEDAVSLPFGAGTALYFLEQVDIHRGQKVLINGASGGVGCYLVQMVKAKGAEVTGVCSGRNADMVRELGADRIIDYTQEDFTQHKGAYDVIINTATNKMTFAQAKPALKPDGVYVAVAFSIGEMIQSIWNKRLVAGSPKEEASSLAKLVALLEAGDIQPVVDTVYPFDELVEAHCHLESGKKCGGIVIRVQGND